MRISFKTPSTILILAVFSAVAAGASTYEEATEAMRTGDYARAAALLEQTIEASPPWAAGHIALAQCQFLLGLPDPAQSNLDRAVELDPAADVFGGYAFAGFKLYNEKRYDEAILPLEQALRRAPEARVAPLSLRLATALFQVGKYADARDRLQRHLDQFGFEAGTAYLLAVSLRHSGESVAALDTLEQAYAGGLTGARQARAVERLARWAVEHAWTATVPDERAARMTRAVDHARAWRDRDPDDAEALAFWFDTARSAGRVPQAIAWLEQRSTSASGDCLGHALLAEAYALARRGDDALRQAVAAIDCDQDSGRSHYARALALVSGIEPEYHTSESVVLAQERLMRARESITGAIRLEPALEHRAAKLNDRIDAAETALEIALEAILEDEKNVRVALRKQQLVRCKSIHWNLKTDRAAVTEDDRLFYESYDCRKRVLGSSRG